MAAWVGVGPVAVPYQRPAAAILAVWQPVAPLPPVPVKVAALIPAAGQPAPHNPWAAVVRRSWDAAVPTPQQPAPRQPIAPPPPPPSVPVGRPVSLAVRDWDPTPAAPQQNPRPVASFARSVDRPPPQRAAPNVAAAWLPVWVPPPAVRFAPVQPPPPTPVPRTALPAVVLTSWAPAALQPLPPIKVAPLAPAPGRPHPLPVWVVGIVTSWAPVWSPPPGLARFPAFVTVPGPSGYAVTLAAYDASQVALCGRAGAP